ncbi:MAG: adenine nucleotide alpha hydrolase family protein [Chloroflexi bacterium]|nr:adenine nucleotide alpha hydrolase family protein [Chloroflexota bacterium]
MPEHHLALCKEHYLDWIPEQTERFINKYDMFTRKERILVAVSGGKDSLSLWDVLWRLGYQADGLYISLGIDAGMHYSRQSQAFAERFAAQRNLNLIVVDFKETFGESIPDLSLRTHRGKGKPCAVCGISKRHIMNQAARDGGYQVLATGHNLDDEAATLFGNTLQWMGEQLLRQGPVLEAGSGLVRKVKPFCRFYERETAAYALLRGIDYVYDECPFAAGSKSIYYKNLLNRLEADRPGAKLTFYLSFLEARESGLFAAHTSRETVQLNTCPNCGQPTTNEGLCAFCRQVARVQV